MGKQHCSPQKVQQAPRGHMFKVHVIHAGNQHLYEEAPDQHHHIRHDIYVGERQWMDLQRADGYALRRTLR
jgi:hypothetical protein